MSFVTFITNCLRELRENKNAAHLVVSAGTVLLGTAVGRFAAQNPRLALLLCGGIALLFVLAVVFFRDGKLVVKRIVVPLIFVSILLPPIRMPEAVPNIRFELIFVFIAWILLLLGSLSVGRGITFKWNPVYKWFFFFGAVIFISIIHAALAKGYYPMWRDFFEFAKLLEYFLIFVLLASLDISASELRKYYLISSSVFLCSAFLGFAQYWNILGINDIISPYYAPTQMRGLLVHGRITGTTGNPNEFGALMVLAASLSLSGALWLKGRGVRIFSFLAFGIYVFAIILTLSRSALIALAFAVFLILLKYPIMAGIPKTIKKFLPVAVGLFVIILLITQLAPPKFFFRVEQLLHFTEATSWQGRVANWETHFAIWTESPWLGWGPGKATMGTIVDNEWLLLLRRYGVVGLAIFLGLFGSLFLGLSRIRRVNSETSVVALSVALQGTLVGYALYMMLAAVYHSLQLMPILLLFLGLAYSQWRPRRSRAEEAS